MKTVRDQSEYPLLIRFAGWSFAVSLVAAMGLLCWSAIAFAPSAHAFRAKSGLVLLWILAAAGICTVRTAIIAIQCRRRLPQTFDRPCPEWATGGALLLILATLFWPM